MENQITILLYLLCVVAIAHHIVVTKKRETNSKLKTLEIRKERIIKELTEIKQIEREKRAAKLAEETKEIKKKQLKPDLTEQELNRLTAPSNKFYQIMYEKDAIFTIPGLYKDVMEDEETELSDFSFLRHGYRDEDTMIVA